jgi:hypothetical protein
VNKRHILDNEWLEALAASGPAALKIVEQIKSAAPARPPCVRRSRLPQASIVVESFSQIERRIDGRARGKEISAATIARELNLKRDTVQSLRNAVARGEKESERVRHHRKTSWQIMPAGLAGRMLVTDPDEAVLIRPAMQAALLGNT